MDAKPLNFQDAFCARYHCPASEFERRVFWRGVYRHALPLAILLDRLSPRFFQVDMEFIRWLAGAASRSEVQEDLKRLEYSHMVAPHWLRSFLLVRVSPVRIRVLVSRCLPA